MFWRTRPIRTSSPGSANRSPSPEAFGCDWHEPAPPPQKVSPAAPGVQARPILGPDSQAFTVIAPVPEQVLMFASSRTTTARTTTLARGTFLQVAASEKKGPL